MRWADLLYVMVWCLYVMVLIALLRRAAAALGFFCRVTAGTCLFKSAPEQWLRFEKHAQVRDRARPSALPLLARGTVQVNIRSLMRLNPDNKQR